MNYTFYYDESGNNRKIKFMDGKFNVKGNYYFTIFGLGISAIDDKAMLDSEIKELKQELKIQGDEIKFSQVKGKNRVGFYDSLDSKKLNSVLDFICTNFNKITYGVYDPVYYALVDIIESLKLSEQEYGNIFEIKDELYELFVRKQKEFTLILEKYNFPNITRGREFYDELISITDDDMLKDALSNDFNILDYGNAKSLIFVDNDKNTAIESYYDFYYSLMIQNRHSTHIFDSEDSFYKKDKNGLSQKDRWDLYNKRENNKDFDVSFVNSKQEPIIWLSDCMAGLIRLYFYELATKGISTQGLSQIQKNNLWLLEDILKPTIPNKLIKYNVIIPYSDIIKIKNHLDYHDFHLGEDLGIPIF